MFDAIWHWWLALPVFAASLLAAGVIWAKAIKPVIEGVDTLLDWAEFLHNEMSGAEGSLKAEITSVQTQLVAVAEQVDSGSNQIEAVAVQVRDVISQVDNVASKVDSMDTVWSKWVFSHASEHAEIWRILAQLGYDRRHYVEESQ